MNETLSQKLANLPDRPGCYLFKDQTGKVIYVGKALILKNRVRSYFHTSRPEHPKLTALVRKITDLEWIITDSEVEALILENTLIKEHKPRYNINLRDDKTYPFIRITNEDFPQVFVTRKIIRDGSQYFGPYTDVKNVRFTLKTLFRIFPIRTCKFDLNPETIARGKVSLCLDYYIKKCQGPCQSLQSREDYQAMINRVRRFLKGKTDDLVKELQAEMKSAAESLEFEEAARQRDKLAALEQYRNSQKVVQSDARDRDVLTMAREDNEACVVLFKVREGKIIGRIHYFLSNVEWQEEGEILEQFISQYYAATDDLPQEIMLPAVIGTAGLVEQMLSDRSQRRVNLVVPKIGDKLKLIGLGQKNARYLLDDLRLQRQKSRDFVPHAVNALQRDLRLESVPRHIECFDISNIQGTDAVASMVYFEDGKPKKSEYRKYKITVKDSPDDFAMMREVVRRRYTRILQEGKKLPDLIMVDGGKGQLSSAVGVLRELGLDTVPVIGLAKRLEEIFRPGLPEAQMLPRSSSGLRLLQQLRDEAHRFAVTFHRERRSKRTLVSELEAIPGIGEKRRSALLQIFGSVKKIKQLDTETLIRDGKIPQSLAIRIYEHFHPKN